MVQPPAHVVNLEVLGSPLHSITALRHRSAPELPINSTQPMQHRRAPPPMPTNFSAPTLAAAQPTQPHRAPPPIPTNSRQRPAPVRHAWDKWAEPATPARSGLHEKSQKDKVMSLWTASYLPTSYRSNPRLPRPVEDDDPRAHPHRPNSAPIDLFRNRGAVGLATAAPTRPCSARGYAAIT